MSKYTTEIRYICETNAGLESSTGFNNINHVISNAAPKIFNFNFPIFDENYRLPLEIKILRHYYTREIGLETVGLWKLKLQSKLCEIMPYYNKLYKSELLVFNPFYDVDLTKESTRNFDGTTDNELTDKAETKTVPNLTTTYTNQVTNKNSETPMGSLSGVLNDNYMTSANVENQNASTQNTGTSVTSNEDEQTSKSTIKNIDDYIETVKGKQGSTDYSSLLIKFRETFLNIDMMIIDDLNELFMKIF